VQLYATGPLSFRSGNRSDRAPGNGNANKVLKLNVQFDESKRKFPIWNGPPQN
jgi:hypothetical protein